MVGIVFDAQHPQNEAQRLTFSLQELCGLAYTDRGGRLDTTDDLT